MTVGTLLALCLTTSPGYAAESVVLKSNEMHKATEHVSFGIEFINLTFLSFEKPNERNKNNIVGFKQVVIWDSGKLVTITVSDEEWQETRARTTHGCVKGRSLAKARFTFDVKPQAAPADFSKAIEGTNVRLVSAVFYEERKGK